MGIRRLTSADKRELVDELDRLRDELVIVKSSKMTNLTKIMGGVSSGFGMRNFINNQELKHNVNELINNSSDFTHNLASSPEVMAVATGAGLIVGGAMHFVDKFDQKRRINKLLKQIQEIELKLYGRIYTKG